MVAPQQTGKMCPSTTAPRSHRARGSRGKPCRMQGGPSSSACRAQAGRLGLRGMEMSLGKWSDAAVGQPELELRSAMAFCRESSSGAHVT